MYVSPDSDRLPGEPLRVRASAPRFLARLVLRATLVLLLSGVTAPLWPPFAIGVWLWGWPPHQPRPAEVWRYLWNACTERPPAPGIPPLSRAWLLLRIVEATLLVPVHGLAWYLDEVVYGRALGRTPVRAPLLLLSAARSGSTQLSRTLEREPSLVAPTFLQCAFPYLWLWRLVGATVGRVVSREWVRERFQASLNPEFVARHEVDPFGADTFEIPFLARHLHMLAPMLGPRVMAEDKVFMGTAPHNREMWDRDFVDFLDRLGRKALLDGPPGGRLFVKGHFLEARDALARRYPEAHFLTVIRDPRKRLRSMVNHIHGNPFDDALGAVPWAWLTPCVARAEVAYCDTELAWFTGAAGPDRTVIRFRDFTDDLEGTMTEICRRVLGLETLPARMPRTHPPRERTHYPVNRTLAEVGIDADALERRLAAYSAWCRGPEVSRVASG